MTEMDMEERFDYEKAVAELEGIAAKVEDPATKLDDIEGKDRQTGQGIIA